MEPKRWEMDDTGDDQGRRDQDGGGVPDGHGNTATFKTYSSLTCQDKGRQDDISLCETYWVADVDTFRGYGADRVYNVTC